MVKLKGSSSICKSAEIERDIKYKKKKDPCTIQEMDMHWQQKSHTPLLKASKICQTTTRYFKYMYINNVGYSKG